MSRFLFLVLPLLVMTMAVFGLAQELVGLDGPLGATAYGLTATLELTLGSWCLESLALVALFLLAQGQSPTWWLDGLLAGWIGWTLRGPLVVLGIATYGRDPLAPWWRLAMSWWVLYTLCGLLIAVVARRVHLAEELRG